MTDHIALAHCRHRAVATGPAGSPFRLCCHCGAAVETRQAYWASGIYDETDNEQRYCEEMA